MFERFSRSWGLIKASAGVLAKDKELLVFPLLSAVCTLIVAAAFVLPAFGMGALDGLREGGMSPTAYVFAFLFYLVQYFVIFFFNSALVGAAMIRLDGGDPTVRDGLRIAGGKVVPILGYAAIAATVGVLLQALKGRDNNVLVRLVGSGLGVAWTLATFLVVPVLVSREVGPVDALKESVGLLRRTWGENAIGHVGIGAAFGLLTFGAVVFAVALVAFAAQASVALAVAMGVLGVLGVLLLGIYQAALTGIYSAVLYRYAVSHETPPAFRHLQLGQAFAPKA